MTGIKMVNGYSQAVMESLDAETLTALDKRFIRDETNAIINGDKGYAFCHSQLMHILERLAVKLKTDANNILNLVLIEQK